MIRPVMVAILALGAAGAQAAECRGARFPDHVDVHGTNLTLNGVGLRTATIFNVQVYVAALYVGKPGTDPRPLIDSTGPTQVVLHFLRNLSAGQIRDAWAEGITKGGSAAQVAPLAGRLAQLSSWMQDTKAGQRLTFTRVPGEGLTVELDGHPKGTIPGDDFARAFLGIWLGDHPPTTAVKSGMLGGACG